MPRDDVTQSQAMPSDPKHVGYNPAVVGNWSTPPDTVQKALDGIARSIPSGAHAALTNAPTGLPNNTDTTIAFVPGTRTFTIAPVGDSFTYYIAGIEYTVESADSIVLADTSGIHWIYYDGDTLTEVIDPAHSVVDDLIINKVRVGLVYWNATDGAAYVSANERHKTGMDKTTQEWLHDHIGTIWHLGLDISGYTLNTDTDAALTFELTDGAIDDEDVQHDIVDGAPATQYAQQLNGGDAEIPVLHRDDIDGSWTEVAASTLPYLTTGTGRLARNNNDGDGTYSQVEIANNKYVNYYVYGTNDWVYPIKMIQGQVEHTSQAAAVVAVQTDVAAFGALPSPEFVLLYAFSLQTSNGFVVGAKKAKIVAVEDFRQQSLSGGAASPGQAHPMLSTTHSDTTAAAVTRGSIIVADSMPSWTELAIGAAGTFLRSGATDVAWDGTVPTASGVIADNAIVRGDGGARGIQGSSATIGDDGVIIVPGIGDGGLTNYDLRVGNIVVPDYGMIQIGNSLIGRTSYKVGNIDLDGAILVRNIGGPVTSEIEFIWTESTGDTCRFALPKSAVGNATYNSRSFLLAGPAPADTDFVKVTYWQGTGIFHNLACDTAGDGADLGVQNDLEVEGDIYTDSIKESTPGADITLVNDVAVGGTVDGRDVAADGTTLDNHVADTTDPHGAIMSVTTRLSTPEIRQSGGDLILEVLDPTADRVVYVQNSGGSKEADLNVERNIIVGGTVDGRDIATDGGVLDTALQDVVDDTSPTLGGELDAAAHSIGFTLQTATGDGTTTIDWTKGNHFDFTFGAMNEVFTFTAPTKPTILSLGLIQDGVGGRSMSFDDPWAGVSVLHPGSIQPALSSAASAKDIILYRWNGTNYWCLGIARALG